ncbi:hypothetical protein H920_02518 [Fukomys damarensis]|uniref:Uncharacterized protein n=1 Tax=Fukomys damarensis TaxID=885580 RepID=A0A091DVL0_FUKDA|nr:hypothetical protein H920_02518 [Fukomys damarensis]
MPGDQGPGNKLESLVDTTPAQVGPPPRRTHSPNLQAVGSRQATILLPLRTSSPALARRSLEPSLHVNKLCLLTKSTASAAGRTDRHMRSLDVTPLALHPCSRGCSFSCTFHQSLPQLSSLCLTPGCTIYFWEAHGSLSMDNIWENAHIRVDEPCETSKAC